MLIEEKLKLVLILKNWISLILGYNKTLKI